MEQTNIFTTTIAQQPVFSKESFIQEVVPQIQEILNMMFPNDPQKRKISVLRNRISFAAPCCGDSATNHTKKRGNIILDGKYAFMYKCFNCGTYMSIADFLDRYGKRLSLDTISSITSQRKEIANQTFDSSISTSIYDIDTIESLSIDRNMFREMFRLTECTEYCKGREYLIKRGQYDMSKFLYSIETNKLFILNLTPSGKIFGMQVRRFDNGPKYKTYSLQKIHELILKDGINVPDDINTLSMLFNILLINYNVPVTVTEGPMDAFLIKNSIALCGAAKNMKFPFDHRYLFDDDVTGREHAIEKMKDGHKVFLWSKFRNDLFIESKKKWDFNDIVLYCKTNNIKIPNLSEYFSNDTLDMIKI